MGRSLPTTENGKKRTFAFLHFAMIIDLKKSCAPLRKLNKMQLMTPYKKLKLANALMLLGVIVMIFGFYRFFAIVAPAPFRMSMAGDGFLILGLFVIPALLASLSGFAWSLIVEKRNPSARVPGTYALRIVVFIFLLVPMVSAFFRSWTD